MIKVFADKRKPKSRRKRSQKPLTNRLDDLNPMAFAILAIKHQENPSNEFIAKSFRVISEKPEMLTEKWVNSINKFVEANINAALLDPPNIEEGSRESFGPLSVLKIVAAKEDSQYPMPAIICLDDRGWKFYFKTSKAYSYKVGDLISFTATVSSHKEGITFLRRPSKIVTNNSEDTLEVQSDDK